MQAPGSLHPGWSPILLVPPPQGDVSVLAAPIFPERRYPKPLGCKSPSGPLVPVSDMEAVTGGTGRAFSVMGSHLKE